MEISPDILVNGLYFNRSIILTINCLQLQLFQQGHSTSMPLLLLTANVFYVRLFIYLFSMQKCMFLCAHWLGTKTCTVLTSKQMDNRCFSCEFPLIQIQVRHINAFAALWKTEVGTWGLQDVMAELRRAWSSPKKLRQAGGEESSDSKVSKSSAYIHRDAAAAASLKVNHCHFCCWSVMQCHRGCL